MYIWDLTITQAERLYYVFQAENDAGSCFMIEASDIGSGTHRIINLVLCDCPNAVIYVSDLTGNRNQIESIMRLRQVSYSFDQ